MFCQHVQANGLARVLQYLRCLRWEKLEGEDRLLRPLRLRKLVLDMHVCGLDFPASVLRGQFGFDLEGNAGPMCTFIVQEVVGQMVLIFRFQSYSSLPRRKSRGDWWHPSQQHVRAHFY